MHAARQPWSWLIFDVSQNMKDPVLAAKLAAFQFDHGAPKLSFSERLARDNRWTLDFTKRVIREYLRFVYLACVSERPVTPSVAVDQVWHLHLCYTRSYWTELCQGTLNEPLHHGPTRGGLEEGIKYREQYEHTIELYRSEFGEAAPEDIWPNSARRFSADASPISLTRDRYLIVEKARLKIVGRAAAMLGVAALGSGAVAQSSGDIVMAVLAFSALAGLIWWLTKRGDKKDKKSDGSGCGGSSGCSGCGGD